MKATGIVRRIDDLGRVVIPKEIRRTLRIREGDPLEIYVDRDGEVILKKFSPIGELGEFAKEYAESLFENTHHIALIADRDHVVAMAGGSKREYAEKEIGLSLERCIDHRESLTAFEGGTFHLIRDVEEPVSSLVAAPIITGGDPIGAVVLFNKDESTRMTQTELVVVETAAAFLGKQMEH